MTGEMQQRIIIQYTGTRFIVIGRPNSTTSNSKNNSATVSAIGALVRKLLTARLNLQLLLLACPPAASCQLHLGLVPGVYT